MNNAMAFNVELVIIYNWIDLEGRSFFRSIGSQQTWDLLERIFVYLLSEILSNSWKTYPKLDHKPLHKSQQPRELARWRTKNSPKIFQHVFLSYPSG